MRGLEVTNFGKCEDWPAVTPVLSMNHQLGVPASAGVVSLRLKPGLQAQALVRGLNTRKEFRARLATNPVTRAAIFLIHHRDTPRISA